mgnify:CR=1 FL=1
MRVSRRLPGIPQLRCSSRAGGGGRGRAAAAAAPRPPPPPPFHRAPPPPPPPPPACLQRDGLKWKLEGRSTARQALLTSGLLPMLAAPTPSGARAQRLGRALAVG